MRPAHSASPTPGMATANRAGENWPPGCRVLSGPASVVAKPSITVTEMTSISRHLFQGAIAGAAGTTALNAATYLDMALRARPASSTSEQTVERGATLLGLSLPGDEDEEHARASGLGSLLGAVTGVGAGAALGAFRGVTGRPCSPVGTVGAAWALAMLAGNGPMTGLRVTDPRRWRAVDWVADIIPHLAYAAVAAAALDAFEPHR